MKNVTYYESGHFKNKAKAIIQFLTGWALLLRFVWSANANVLIELNLRFWLIQCWSSGSIEVSILAFCLFLKFHLLNFKDFFKGIYCYSVILLQF